MALKSLGRLSNKEEQSKWNVSSSRSTSAVQHFDDCRLYQYQQAKLAANKYKNELKALADIRKQQKQTEKKIRDADEAKSSKVLFPSKQFKSSKEKIRDQKSIRVLPGDNFKVYDNVKQFQAVKCYNPSGGCGEPLMNGKGEALTKRYKSVRAIQGATNDESLLSVISNKKEENRKLWYPLMKRKNSGNLRRKNCNDKPFEASCRTDITNEGKLPIRKEAQQYIRNELQHEIVKQKLIKEEERISYLKPTGDMTSVLGQGRVGRPERHPLTGAILPLRRKFTDITFHLLKGHGDKKPASYLSDLIKMAEERRAMKTQESKKVLNKNSQHNKIFNSYFDRPGYGAPLNSGVLRRKFSDCGIRASLGKMGTSVIRECDKRKSECCERTCKLKMDSKENFGKNDDLSFQKFKSEYRRSF